MFYRQRLGAEDHANPRTRAYTKIQDRQQWPALADDPPAAFFSGPLMAIKFDQA
jgi:hypothetical protein